MPDRARAVARDVVAVLGGLAVLGVLCGVVWSIVVTPAEFTKLPNGAAMNEAALSVQFGADGWYLVIAAVAGLVSGFALTRLRTRDALLTAVLLVLGAVTAAVLMSWTGHLLGPANPRDVLAAAKVGTKIPESLTLGVGPVSPFGHYLKETVMFYLAWPVAVLAGCLAVLVSGVPAADHHDPDNETDPDEAVDDARPDRSVQQSPTTDGPSL
jgi:hypothetical protein